MKLISTLRLLGLLLSVPFALTAADLPYAKKATREETRQATLAAIQQLFGNTEFKQSPWHFIGPFDNAGRKGLTTVYPPEQEFKLEAEYEGLNGQKVRWQDGSKFKDGQVNNLKLLKNNNDLITYLYRTVECDQDQSAILFVGSDDSIAIWVNGKKVHDYRGIRPAKVDEERVSIRLHKGTNQVLLKVGNVGGEYAFAYRLSALSSDSQAKYDELLTQLDERLDVDFPTGEGAYYRLETITIPHPITLEVGGMTFMPDGNLMICTRRGEVWAYYPATQQWKLFASGLHEPLGIYAVGPGEIIVAQRPELTRIKDTDGDGEADTFETLTDAFGISGNYHEYHYGPVRDQKGNLYGTLNLAWEGRGTAPVPYRGTFYRLAPDGQFSIFANGFRSPAGIGLSPTGEMFVTDNQGDWWGSSPVLHVQAGDFFGHPASLKWTPGYKGPDDPATIPPERLAQIRKLPSAWFRYGAMGNSPTEPIWDTTNGKFGPFKEQMFVGDQTKSFLMRIALEKVDGEYQGAIFPFRAGFGSGILRVVFDAEGKLYVGGTDRGWGSTGGRPFALQRLSWTGRMPMEIETMKLTRTGFDLHFTKPVEVATASNTASYSFQRYFYHYHPQYGSPEVDVTPLNVASLSVSADHRTVSLVLPEFEKERIYELHIKGLKAEDGTELLHDAAYYTVNRLVK